jgi:hypothetical protein
MGLWDSLLGDADWYEAAAEDDSDDENDLDEGKR